MPFLQGPLVGLVVALVAMPQDQQVQSEVDKLKKAVEELQRELNAQKEQVEQLKQAQEAQSASEEQRALDEAVSRAMAESPSSQAAPAARPTGGNLFNPKISFDVLTSAMASSVPNPPNFGGHDPNERGFQIPQAELSIQNPVDPFFNFEAHIVWSLRNGETNTELEEAFATTTSLPYNLQVRAGQFFTRFGRQNAMHAHAWEFATIPIVIPRFFGPDGFRNPGVEVSWLAPTDTYLKLAYTIQQADGENAVSFLGQEDTELAGYPFTNRTVEGLNDFAHTFRVETSQPYSDTVTGTAGFSAMLGDNATGSHNLSQIYGVDYFVKWRPLDAEKGFPFVVWQTEYMNRFASVGPNADANLPPDRLKDYGFYSQLIWGFTPGWTVGLRAQQANGTGGIGRDTNQLLDKFFRVGPALTYYPSEFSKIRFCYDADFQSSENGGPGSEFILEFEVAVGEHPAHSF